ncbi:MAG: prepilin-type N-terminal cleavage/methylation domain-containing protein [Planctomycetes bacterium]|nr:prepilin-type N-terminal cleavage/methylation domain-containing protein [Planctomycetota bacterium]
MKRGFTLIEVLVVVAIIALLISILIPSLAAARDAARSAKCLANTRDMATGVNTFASSHRSRFQLVTGASANPDPYSLGGPVADPRRSLYAYEAGPLPLGAQGPALLAWPVVLLREAGRRDLKQNAQWGVEADTAGDAKPTRQFESLVCPADDIKVATPHYPQTKSGKRWFGFLSYAVSEDITGDRVELGDPGGPVWKDGNMGGKAGGGERLQGMLDKVIRPSEVLLFVDGGARDAASDGKGNLIISRLARGPLLEYAEKQWNGRLPTQRHRRGTLNVTFADGHGSWTQRVSKTQTDSRLPDWAYVPRVRVSPYNSGTFPNLGN